MDKERWDRLVQIFDKAQDFPPGERASFVEEACGADGEMFQEVASLLAQATDDGDNRIVGEAAEALLAEKMSEGQRIGQYRLLRRLGVGGMGDVYLADRVDGEFDQRIALKLVRFGAQSEQILLRFRAERQILAQLQHPNIAQLLDGGMTDKGQPYFVMEYVDGMPLTEYCDKHTLSIEKRLRLFLQVCNAVTYAHSKLVIHRDLKPSNILVTDDGVIKLLDFGIAKLIGDDEVSTQLTRTGMSVMTPSYASPEQALGESVSTATDVYSLGMILYELLAGKRPYEVDSNNPVQAAEIICRSQPERLSTSITDTARVSAKEIAEIGAARQLGPGRLKKAFAGDLDTICLKTLRKEAERRYISADELSNDIKRYLDGLPIAARPDTLAYRSGKFVRRNCVAVTTATLMVAVLISTVTIYTERVTDARNDSEAVAEFVTDILLLAAPLREGVDVKLVDAIDLAADNLTEGFAGDERTRAHLQHFLGRTYYALSQYESAVTFLQPALVTRAAIFGPASLEARQTRRSLVELYSNMQHPDLEALTEEALTYAPATPDKPSIRVELIAARIVEARGDLEEALPMFVDVHQRSERYLGEDAIETLSALLAVARIQGDIGRYAEAEELLKEIVVRNVRIGSRAEIARAKTELAVLYGNMERHDESILLQEEVLEIQIAIGGEKNWNVTITMGNLAYGYLKVGRQAEAETMIIKSVETKIDILGEHHRSTLFGYIFAAQIFAKRSIEEGREYCDRALGGAAITWPDGHWRTGEFNKTCSDLHSDAGDPERALVYALKAWEHFEVTPYPTPQVMAETVGRIRALYEQFGNVEEEARFRALYDEQVAEMRTEDPEPQPGT